MSSLQACFMRFNRLFASRAATLGAGLGVGLGAGLALFLTAGQLAAGQLAAGQLVLLGGQAEQGRLMVFSCAPGCAAQLDEAPLFIDLGGRFVIGFHRDDSQPRQLQVSWPDGRQESRLITPAPRRYKIQRIDGLPEKFVTPSEAVLARIRADADNVRRARQQITEQDDFIRNGFDWPAKGRITGIYGSQRILNGQPRQPHYGIDIALARGTPVRAAAAGRVVLADDLYFTGWTVILDHGHGVSSTYSHLQETAVKTGQQLARGAVLGLSGSTGRSTGPHLDWRVNWLDKRLDPQKITGRPADWAAGAGQAAD